MARLRSATRAEVSSVDPLEPLGYVGMVFFYRRATDGAVVELHARDHTAPGLLALAGADASWFFDAWGDERDGIHWESAAGYLMRSCFQRGPYRAAAVEAGV